MVLAVFLVRSLEKTDRERLIYWFKPKWYYTCISEWRMMSTEVKQPFSQLEDKQKLQQRWTLYVTLNSTYWAHHLLHTPQWPALPDEYDRPLSSSRAERHPAESSRTTNSQRHTFRVLLYISNLHAKWCQLFSRNIVPYKICCKFLNRILVLYSAYRSCNHQTS